MSPMVIPASPVVLEPIQAAPRAQKSVSTSTSTISSEQPSACAKTLNNQLTTNWKPIKAAELVQRLVNPIRDVVSAIDLSGSDVGGKSFLNLGLGDPSVFSNLPPPPAALNAIVGAVMNGTADGYPQSVGYDDTRTAVADYFDSDDWKVQKKDVVMTLGASGALEMAFAITADAGKNVLLPRPLFTAYETMLATTHAEIRYYDLLPDCNWEIDLASMESQIDQNTVFVLINNPSNPTGSNFSRSHLIRVASLAAKLRVLVIADEVYAGMAWSVTGPAPAARVKIPGKFNRGLFIPYASVAGDSPVLVVGALSKRWLAPGWRTGWLIVHDPKNLLSAVRDGLGRYAFRIQGDDFGSNLINFINESIGPPSAMQKAIPSILANTPESFFDETLVTLEDTGIALFNRLEKIEGLAPLLPQGAMYLMCRITDGVRSTKETYPAFENDREFITAFFKEENTLILPGQCFRLPNYLRFVTTVPLPILLQACDRLDSFCARHRAKIAV